MSKLHNIYADAWVTIRYNVENIYYCKAIRESEML